jgi:hypothetical protein
LGWWRVWTANDTKGGERRERVSCFSWFFACFVIQSTDALVYELYGLTGEEIGVVDKRVRERWLSAAHSDLKEGGNERCPQC